MMILIRARTSAKSIIYSFLSLLLASCSSGAPTNIGLADGKLAECPTTPNCVCSEVLETETYVTPLTLVAADGTLPWAALQEEVKGLGGTIEIATDNYIWATFHSRLFRFVDDLELRRDLEQGIVHVRSASRLGYSDFGVNRERVESLRKRFTQRIGAQVRQ